MKVIQLMYPYQIHPSNIDGPYSLAIGFFDGVHRGHQVVIEEAKKQATQKKLKLAVMTFDPHPSIVLGQRKGQVFYITTRASILHYHIETKIRNFGESPCGYCICCPIYI
jgi:riboflavin kinase/FMN adenylyltransferase